MAGIDPTLLADLVAFLQTFLDASLELEADKNPTLHLAVPWFHKLKNHCLPSVTDSPTMKTIKSSASKLLDEKFKLQIEHFIATCLNPKMRNLKMLDANPLKKQEVYNGLRAMMDESSNWIQLHDQECYEYSHIVQQPPANTSKRLGNFTSGKIIGLLDQLIDC